MAEGGWDQDPWWKSALLVLYFAIVIAAFVLTVVTAVYTVGKWLGGW